MAVLLRLVFMIDDQFKFLTNGLLRHCILSVCCCERLCDAFIVIVIEMSCFEQMFVLIRISDLNRIILIVYVLLKVWLVLLLSLFRCAITR